MARLAGGVERLAPRAMEVSVPITFACECGTSITVPDALAGKQGKCKKCGRTITAPARAGAAKKPPAPVVAAHEATLSEAAVSDTNVDADEDDDAAPAHAAPTGGRTGVVKFKCPKCQVELKVPLHLAGNRGKCRKCGGSFVSPVPDALKKARVRAAVQAGAPPSLKEAFSVVKVRCECGMTSAVLKGRSNEGSEKCPACERALVIETR